MFLPTILVQDVSEQMQQTMKENPDKVYFPNLGGDNIFTNGITINREMFTIPGTSFTIYWYGFLIALGILLAMIYGYKRMRSFGIDPDRATDGVIGGLIGAIAGARLYYIAFNTTGLTFKDFFKFRDGGLAIYGGIIGAILVGGIIVKLRKLKLTAMLDVVAPCFLIGQAVGRWGNFFNQEAFGANTDAPWGMMSYHTMYFLADNRETIAANSGVSVSCFAPVHPCFLYESLWCILCFVIIHLYSKHRKFDGELFLFYTGLYGLGRFIIESTRTDSLYFMNIKVSQLVAGACFVASLILIIIFRSMVKRDGDYKFFYQTELSKMQLKAYDTYEQDEKEKKELKKKIREAKEKGESFIELEKEYDEKFGKGAKEKEKDAIEKDKQDKNDPEYTSILADEDDDKSNDSTEGKSGGHGIKDPELEAKSTVLITEEKTGYSKEEASVIEKTKEETKQLQDERINVENIQNANDVVKARSNNGQQNRYRQNNNKNKNTNNKQNSDQNKNRSNNNKNRYKKPNNKSNSSVKNKADSIKK